MNQARTRPSCTTPSSRSGGRAVGVVAELLASSTARRYASSAPSRSTSFAGRSERLAGGDSQEVLAELHARGELAPRGPRARRPGPAPRARAPRRGRPPRPSAAPRPGAAARRARGASRPAPRPAPRARRAPPSGRCGRRSMSSAWSRASRSPTRSSGVAADGSASSTTRRTSSGAFAASALRLASIENRTHTAPSPAAFAWWASSGRLSGEGSPAISSSTIAAWIARRRGRRERRGRELPDLLVREAVVGGRASSCSTSRPAATAGVSDLGAAPRVRAPRSLHASSTSCRSFRLKRRPSTAASASERLRVVRAAAPPAARSASAPPTGPAARRCAPASRRRRSAGPSRRRGRRGPSPRR